MKSMMSETATEVPDWLVCKINHKYSCPSLYYEQLNGTNKSIEVKGQQMGTLSQAFVNCI